MSIMDAFAVQNMWTSVLVQVARDLTRVQSSEAAMAERWIGTYPTRDFCEVCARAGLEPSASHAWFRKLCDTPFEERKTRTHGLDITVSDAAARPLDFSGMRYPVSPAGHMMPCRPNGRIAGRSGTKSQGPGRMRPRNRISRRIIPALALGIFGTVALSQTEPGSWIELAQTRAGLLGYAHVIDGDTLDIHGTRIRISGIDAPESKQTCQDAQGIPYACGQDATQALIRWIGSQTVICTRWADRASYAPLDWQSISCSRSREAGRDQDRYGRIIAQCSVAGADLGAFMVGSGHAMAYRRFSTAYISAEARARSAGLGMWQGAFTAPWDWRRGQR